MKAHYLRQSIFWSAVNFNSQHNNSTPIVSLVGTHWCIIFTICNRSHDDCGYRGWCARGRIGLIQSSLIFGALLHWRNVMISFGTKTKMFPSVAWIVVPLQNNCSKKRDDEEKVNVTLNRDAFNKQWAQVVHDVECPPTWPH